MAGRKNMDPGLSALCEDAKYWVTAGNLGYDQWQRDSWRNSGWSEGTEVDCSSFVIGLLNRHGYKTGEATYTGNMRKALMANGWVPVGKANMQPGDVLLNDSHHTALYVGNGQLAQASRGEAGHRVHGGQAGDQDGYETNLRAYYDYPWTIVLRYQGAQPTTTGNPNAQERWWLGPKVTKLWQGACGTPVDGVISGQDRSDAKWRPNVTSCQYGKGGSQLVRYVQSKVGAKVNGKWGYETSGKTQQFLIDHGFSVGAAGADHIFGSDSVHGLYDSLTKAPEIWR